MIYMRPRGRRLREAGSRGGLCGLVTAVTIKGVAVGASPGGVGDTVGGPVALRRP